MDQAVGVLAPAKAEEMEQTVGVLAAAKEEEMEQAVKSTAANAFITAATTISPTKKRRRGVQESSNESKEGSDDSEEGEQFQGNLLVSAGNLLVSAAVNAGDLLVSAGKDVVCKQVNFSSASAEDFLLLQPSAMDNKDKHCLELSWLASDKNDGDNDNEDNNNVNNNNNDNNNIQMRLVCVIERKRLCLNPKNRVKHRREIKPLKLAAYKLVSKVIWEAIPAGKLIKAAWITLHNARVVQLSFRMRPEAGSASTRYPYTEEELQEKAIQLDSLPCSCARCVGPGMTKHLHVDNVKTTRYQKRAKFGINLGARDLHRSLSDGRDLNNHDGRALGNLER